MPINPDSCYPADSLARALVGWVHSVNMRCPACHGPALVGFLGGDMVAVTCHRCGPSPKTASLNSDHIPAAIPGQP